MQTENEEKITTQNSNFTESKILNQEKVPLVNPKQEEKQEHPFWELVRFALLAFLIILPIRAFIAQPFIVSGSSMYPTFKDGNYLIVDQISYRLEIPKRGEVIVFKYPKDTSKYFIKRIIGLPGETVTIKGSQVNIKNTAKPEGFDLTEPYVKNLATNDMTVTLGSNEYFVMGDNRSASSDSRSWGNVPKNLIIGRTFVRLLPFSSTGFWPGENIFNQ